MKLIVWAGIAGVCLVACESETTRETIEARPASTGTGTARASASPTSNAGLAEPREYAAAKAAYVARYDTATSFPGMSAALADLDRRARAILGPLPFRDAKWEFNLDAIPVRGNEGGQQLDGLVVVTGRARIVATTPELLAAWVRFMGDSTGEPMKSLGTENMLTWAFFDGAHVYPFGDLMTTGVALPGDVFLAQLIAEGQDTGAPSPESLVVGVDRGKQIFLIKAPLETAMPRVDECGPQGRDAYHICYGEKAQGLAGFDDAVKQVARLSAMIPK
jgi:hypothetical protein